MYFLSHLLIFTVIALILFIYYRARKKLNYFKERGVPNSKAIPVFGSIWDNVIRKKHFFEVFTQLYNDFPDLRFSGFFMFNDPIYLIRDPALIKQICIKDFDHFVNHSNNIDIDIDPMLGRSVFFAKDLRWRHTRNILSPLFTGSKMRLMFSLIAQYCDKIMNTLLTNANGSAKEFEMKDIVTRFGNDIVASVAFGLEVDSLKNRDNEFYVNGKKMVKFDGWPGIKLLLASVCPRLLKLFSKSITDMKTIEFYVNLVSDTIKYREENENFSRNDMLDLLIKAKTKQSIKSDEDEHQFEESFAATEHHSLENTESSIEWTDLDIASQSGTFFFAGFETTANSTCLTIHELALNPDIQDRLRGEVDEVLEQLQGKLLPYEILQKMKYMDMVVTETLRKWPPLAQTDRVCSKQYTITNSDGTEVVLEKNDIIGIPVFAIQRDPKYFPNPEKFDPERFSDDNKHEVDPATFLTFGIGPRNCVGSRFALMQMKAIIFYILKYSRIEVSAKTQHPIQFEKSSFTLNAKNGFWVNFIPRH
uniref:Putative cytochrome n=1 Tax=Corethrella appendiculata TaxID=1370023 RepID=U5EWP7_9DIPT